MSASSPTHFLVCASVATMVVFHEDMKGLSVMEICSCLYQYAIVAAYIATISGNPPISFL